MKSEVTGADGAVVVGALMSIREVWREVMRANCVPAEEGEEVTASRKVEITF